MSGARSRAESTQSEPDSTPVSVFCVSLGILSFPIWCCAPSRLFFLYQCLWPDRRVRTRVRCGCHALSHLLCHPRPGLRPLAGRTPTRPLARAALPLAPGPAPCTRPQAPDAHAHKERCTPRMAKLYFSALSSLDGTWAALAPGVFAHEPSPPLRFGTVSAQTRRTARQRDGSSFCCCTMSPVTCTT